MKIEILKHWSDVVAVNKLAGWLTIPGRGNKANLPVLSHELGAHLRGSLQKAQAPDLFVVHRLDQGTSGVIVFTQTASSHREISKQFENSEVRKTYWALVKGAFSETPQTVNAPLFKLPSKKNKSVVDPKGKPSQTKLKGLASFDSFTLVEAQPLTGRSHQIRVHLSHLGFPIVGDTLYGGQSEALGENFEYPLLHSRSLQLNWPLGERVEITAPMNGKFLSSLKSLGFVNSC